MFGVTIGTPCVPGICAITNPTPPSATVTTTTTSTPTATDTTLLDSLIAGLLSLLYFGLITGNWAYVGGVVR